MKTKRLFSAILAACLTLALILPASAAGTAPSLDDAVQAVTALGILNGDGSGNLNLSAKVTRAEFVWRGRCGPGGHLPLLGCPPEPLGQRLCGGGGKPGTGHRLQRRHLPP